MTFLVDFSQSLCSLSPFSGWIVYICPLGGLRKWLHDSTGGRREWTQWLAGSMWQTGRGSSTGWCNIPLMSLQYSASCIDRGCVPVSDVASRQRLRSACTSSPAECWPYHAIDDVPHSAVGRSQSPDLPSGTHFQTNSEFLTASTLRSGGHDDILSRPVLVCVGAPRLVEAPQGRFKAIVWFLATQIARVCL